MSDLLHASLLLSCMVIFSEGSLYWPGNVSLAVTAMHHIVGENWTAAKKASDSKSSRLPSLSDLNNSVNPASAVNALNGVFKRLMTLGDLNLYNYTGGMPALYGTANNFANGNGNGKVIGTRLPSLDRAEGLQRQVNGVSKQSVQVGILVLLQCTFSWSKVDRQKNEEYRNTFGGCYFLHHMLSSERAVFWHRWGGMGG